MDRLAGRTLGRDREAISAAIWLGLAAVYEDRFPLLVKFLFPADKLSVQVHPDDDQARKCRAALRQDRVLVCAAGETRRTSRAGIEARHDTGEFETSIRENRAEELLNWVDVIAGDMLYVAAGTVHTIGGGMVLVETQQTSDITYRLYDYGAGVNCMSKTESQRLSCIQ